MNPFFAALVVLLVACTPPVAGTNKHPKIDSALMAAIRGERAETRVAYDEKGRALVTIRATVSDALLAEVVARGGVVISSFAEYHDIRAAVPLAAIEELAKRGDVHAIMPLEQATTNDAQRP